MSRMRRGVVAFVVATSATWCGVSAGAVEVTGGERAMAQVEGETAEVAVAKPPQRGVRPGRWGKVRLRLTNVGSAEVAQVRVSGRGTDVFAGTVTMTESLSVGESAIVRLPVLLTVMAPRRFVVEALASGATGPIRRQIVIRPR